MPTPFVAVPSWELEAGEASRIVEQPDPVSPRRANHAVEPEPDAASDASRASSGSAAGGRPSVGVDAGVAAHELDALGPLAEFATDGPVTDLFVNGEAGLWVDRGGGAERDPRWTATEAEVRALAVRLIARGGRHVDEATPAVDVRLARGIRVHAVLPPLSSSGTLLSIRIPRVAGFSLAALARAGMLDAEREQALRRAVLERKNLLVSGAGGTGKTTLLGALLAEAPHRERIVLLEDVAELRLDHPHVVALEARQANLEGSGRIALDVLLREALRMRPDRLVVGECRGPELRELLAALNTGHDGGAGTLHANSLDDVPSRLEALGTTAGMTPEAVARQAVSAFDLVVHLERVDGRRRVAQVGRFALDGGRLAVEPC
ncbi:TadA family conjugal transfer-associated ATPase [Agromyces indicus]|uniref:TadA family conjugal transfer-associated ATPase n=1 Tax=Agromyces indicus TaxID=758919 RepID=A0ABU1FIL6_9MICO|nr:TadA family conjugal transfer-associated ATPase [Agromyces indicus]MDR5691594.1 TadA family conjugal transfer-associated ATPase [Agromyces indicus]